MASIDQELGYISILKYLTFFIKNWGGLLVVKKCQDEKIDFGLDSEAWTQNFAPCGMWILMKYLRD